MAKLRIKQTMPKNSPKILDYDAKGLGEIRTGSPHWEHQMQMGRLKSATSDE